MMKRFFFAVVILFAVSLFSNQSYSQDNWSLERCINYAIENNIQLKQQELNAQYSENSYVQSKAQVLPTLNAGGNHNYNFGRSVDPFTNDFTPNNSMSDNLYVNSSVTLFSGLQNFNTIKQREFDLLASLQDVEKTKNDISLSIASAYLQILFNTELLEIAKQQVEITKQQEERTQKLVDAGSLAMGSLLEIQAQIANEELQVVNSDNQLRLSYLTLTQMLDLENSENFEIEKPLIAMFDNDKLNSSAMDIYNQALSNMPEIKSAEYKLQSTERSLKVAKGGMLPRLTLSGSLGTGYSNARKNYIPGSEIMQSSFPSGITSTGEAVYGLSYATIPVDYVFSDQIRDNANSSVSFGLNIPIFNGWQTQTAISNAKISVLNSQYTLQNSKNVLYKEIQQAHADAIAAYNRFIASEKAISSMEESFRYTQQKFDVGLVNSVDYNLAKNQLTKAKSDLLQSKYEFVFRNKILDFYRGIQIKL